MNDTPDLGSISPQDLQFYLETIQRDQQNAQLDHMLAAIRGQPSEQHTSPGGAALGGIADILNAHNQRKLMDQQGANADAQLQALRNYTRQAGMRYDIAGQDAQGPETRQAPESRLPNYVQVQQPTDMGSFEDMTAGHGGLFGGASGMPDDATQANFMDADYPISPEQLGQSNGMDLGSTLPPEASPKERQLILAIAARGKRGGF